jgi:hypothetical protein
MICNVHQRSLAVPVAEAGFLIDGLAGPDDRLWPSDRWPAMRFDRPLGVGARGGHGPVRYAVGAYVPGRRPHGAAVRLRRAAFGSYSIARHGARPVS